MFFFFLGKVLQKGGGQLVFMPLFLFTKINKKVEKIGLHKIPKGDGGWVGGGSQFCEAFSYFF